MLRAILLKASESEALARQVTSRKLPRAVALRYVAGETLEDGLGAVRGLLEEGRHASLDYLGESVREAAAARGAAQVYLDALDQAAREDLGCGVSVKPTQMGLGFDDGLCRRLLEDIAKAADGARGHLTLDMEGSDLTEATVALVEGLRAAGHRPVGCAVQSYLYRTLDDVKRLTAVGASLRLCKGAYAEPASVAYQRKRDVDANFVACADYLLRHGTYPRFATHDEAIIDHVRARAGELGVAPDQFEFQMLYGVRTSLQEQVVRDGYRLCVYVPFGNDWYRYFMRRLGERPANLVFFLRSLRDT
jgi:proline dehydrogenase